MQHKLYSALLILLSLIGIADATYLSYTALTNTALTCNIKGLDGCNTVAQSVYSHLFGIPLAVYGVAFYVLFFVLACAVLFFSRAWLVKSLVALGVIGLVASIIFELIQVVLIKALCVYCLVSAVTSFFLCIFAVLLWKAASHTPKPNQELPPDAPQDLSHEQAAA